ncbi:MAG: AAA domain-containing protein [Lachnospiraceae bacterium]|nr:AAA domain-containing protein [Lachnospiraceae bacterium]
MPSTAQNLYKAIHEGKWLSIEYENKNRQITRYWIAVRGIDVKRRMLRVDGLHLAQHTVARLDYVSVDAIRSSAIVEGTFYEPNASLIDDIDRNPERYEGIFGTAANLKVLNYLIDCSRLDTEHFETDYSLIRHLDQDNFHGGEYQLSPEQFGAVVCRFQEESAGNDPAKSYKLRQLCMNILSIPVTVRRGQTGLYVLAYRRLFLDVKRRVLKPADEITVCREFTVDGERQSIRRYLDTPDFWMLEHFEEHLEEIKDSITRSNSRLRGVDDRPYLIALASNIQVDLNKEYEGITEMFRNGTPTAPVKAFFGQIVPHNRRRKDYPISLLRRRANLDQLLAIHSAMKYPVAYVQGPPGTGKTWTIVNTILTAFLNGQTVLLASYNNHPINGVVQQLTNISGSGQDSIPFPVIRLGNHQLVDKALDYISRTYARVETMSRQPDAPESDQKERLRRAKQLSALLERYEERLSLTEELETVKDLSRNNQHLAFYTDLVGRQQPDAEKRLQRLGEVDEKEALDLLAEDEAQFLAYLNFMSIKYWKRLGETRYEGLRNILKIADHVQRTRSFSEYIADAGRLKDFLRVFPVVATTCISAHRLGKPQACFDMVIMDEASQCNMAMSLVPILRGRRLLLVGDPQQLSPVIVMDAKDNEILRQRYKIPEEYDYRKNSIYKAFLANDAVSYELLLRYHYRCCRDIIAFNNRKYYNNRLRIDSRVPSDDPLLFIDIEENRAEEKNTAPAEAQKVLEYVQAHRDKSIGVITPFANQKDYIEEILQQNGIEGVSCGTVHAFQGDEKDVILFSTAITDQTAQKTYDWLKNNRELINVATSRARERLVVLSSRDNLERLHGDGREQDDLYELAQYVQTKGHYEVSADSIQSRALGIKPYSTKTEADFLESLNHALDNVLNTQQRCVVRHEVSIAHVFRENVSRSWLFHSGRFDFVVYERARGGEERPILAIELDGREHLTDETVRRRDQEKQAICREQGFELIRVENSYARRYYYIKKILEDYFRHVR